MKTSPIVFTVRSGALAIAVHKYEDARYGFEWTPPGKERVRIRRRSRESAIAEARKLVDATGAGKLDLLKIDPTEFAEFLAWKSTRRKSVPLADVVNSFLAAKGTKGLSEKHVADLRGTLIPFAEIGISLVDMTRQKCEDWLNARGVGPRRFNNQLAHILALVNFARRDGIISHEPHPIEGIERRKVSYAIATYTVAEMARMIAAAKDEDCVAVVLSGLCGIRPQEARPEHGSSKPALQWQSFDWERQVIDLPAAVSKVGERRFVPICDAALAFLSRYKSAHGDCVPLVGSKKRSERVAAASGVTWKADALRHSYASYRLAMIRDVQKLALEMGNSPTMIKRHYLDLKHEDEAVRWFSLRPHNLAEWAR